MLDSVIIQRLSFCLPPPCRLFPSPLILSPPSPMPPPFIHCPCRLLSSVLSPPSSVKGGVRTPERHNHSNV
eukprot:1228751-Pyramimonas_sp.AAC.1